MSSISPLTREHAERLCDLMAQWWAGWSLGQMARAHGISRQRAHYLLMSVGCAARLRAQCGEARNEGARHHDRNEVIEAKVMMAGAAWPRLTLKQRAAVAWLASGMGTAGIATRMGTSQSGVCNLIEAAHWRILGQQAAAEKGGVPELSVRIEPVEPPLALARMESEPAIIAAVATPLPIDDAPEKIEPAPALPVDAAPLVEFDEPDDRKAEPAIESVANPPPVDGAPTSPPEINEADFDAPQSPPVPAPLERKPIRLSDLRPKKPVRWVKLWSSNEPW